MQSLYSYVFALDKAEKLSYIWKMDSLIWNAWRGDKPASPSTIALTGLFAKSCKGDSYLQ
jgi:hypothetical protein